MTISADITSTLIRIALYTLVGSGLVTWAKLRTRWRVRKAVDWPTTVATIHSGSVRPIPQTTTQIATLSYSYFVDEYCSGEFEQTFSNEDTAYDLIRHAKNRKVTVRYSPKHPDTSVLDQASLQEAVNMGIFEDIAGPPEPYPTSVG
jgi:hypothetical protein